MADTASASGNGVSSHTDQTDDVVTETTPLLLTQTKSQDIAAVEAVAVPLESEIKRISTGDQRATEWPRSTKWFIFLCAFVTSLGFGVTQAPILYMFRIMVCDAYYKDHPSESQLNSTSPSSLMKNASIDMDRCSIHEIESATALSISLLGGMTTLFGLMNLFVTGNLMKRIGLKPTLIIQLLLPAVRLFIQNVAIDLGGHTGILVFQCSQMVSILGGPSGYVLVLNSYIAEVIDYEGRTAALGVLQGCMMFGSALGFLSGGLISDAFGIKSPFRVTFVMFLLSSSYASLTLPSILPDKSAKGDSKAKAKAQENGIARFFGPLAVFIPAKFVGKDNVIRTEYGCFLLACGVFLGINATGYMPTLLQLYSTDKFGFKPKENGALVFLYSVLRGLFLTIAFPKIIAVGRRWTVKREERVRDAIKSDGEREGLLSEDGAADESSSKKEQTFTFDLQYTKFSLIADGILTALCSLVRDGWQMYLVATILPFAAGTGSAAKGTILQMIGSSATRDERTDALAGISLVENIARLSTTCIFGVFFAGFASIGRLELIFIANAGFALIAFGVMCFARFPSEGSRRLDKAQEEVESVAE